MPRWLAFGGMALGLSLVGYAVFARETDEERIAGVLGRLEKAVRIDGDTATNPIFRAGQLRKDFADVFDKNVGYRIPELGSPSNGIESLVGVATRGSTALTTLDIGFSHPDVKIVPPGTNATVDTTAHIRAFRGSQPYEQGERQVHFGFSKTTGDWRIDSVNVEARE